MASQPPAPPSAGSVPTPPPPGQQAFAQQAGAKRGWFGRNWGWVLGCGCLSVVVLGVAVVLLFIFGVFSLGMGMLKENDAYRQAVQQVQNSPEARELLGSPIEPGYLVTGSINVKNSTGNANLMIPVTGPKGEGTLHVRATRSGGGLWTFQSLTLQVPGKAPLDLMTGAGPETLEAPEGGTAPPNPEKAVELHEQGVKEFAASIREPERRDGAFALLEEAVRRDPTNDALKLDLADAYVQTGHEVALAFAIDVYEELLERQPQSDAIIARLADAYAELENYKTAFQFLERRLQLPTPNVRGAALQTTTLAVDSGELDRGQRLLREISAKNPGELGVRLLLATLLAENGRTTEARLVIEEARTRIPPNDPLAAQARKMLERLTP